MKKRGGRLGAEGGGAGRVGLGESHIRTHDPNDMIF